MWLHRDDIISLWGVLLCTHCTGLLPAVYYATSKKYQALNRLRIFNPHEFVGTKEKSKTLPQNFLVLVVFVPQREIKVLCT